MQDVGIVLQSVFETIHNTINAKNALLNESTNLLKVLLRLVIGASLVNSWRRPSLVLLLGVLARLWLLEVTICHLRVNIVVIWIICVVWLAHLVATLINLLQ